MLCIRNIVDNKCVISMFCTSYTYSTTIYFVILYDIATTDVNCFPKCPKLEELDALDRASSRVIDLWSNGSAINGN